MFRSSTIIRQLALNLAKSYIYVKTFGEITSLFIMRLCGSMSCNGVCVLHDTLPHNVIINNDVISSNVLTQI
jgi:hypothetical protein